MNVEIRNVSGEYIIMIDGRPLSYKLPSLESALAEVREIFESQE